MIRRSTTGLVLAVALAIVAAACVETKHEGPTSPSEVAKVLTTGNWSSTASAVSSGLNPGSCGNLEWKITSMTDASASGTFKATCGGGLTLATLLATPHPLPRMDFTGGIPPESRTLVVIPTMLTSSQNIEDLVEALDQLAKSPVDVVYVVDSFGALYCEQIEYLVKLFKQHLYLQ